ncbi:MAG: CRISPR-associated endonuclease Cas1 [Planctomycetota bacterium]
MPIQSVIAMSDEPETNAGNGQSDLLPARMLNEFVYCPRLFHLEWVQNEWSDSADTVAGQRDHRRVDRESGHLPDAEAAVDPDAASFEARSITLSAPLEGLIAKLDLIEGADGSVVPIDYKHGEAPDIPEGAWEADRVQVCAQALVLRENGYKCDEAAIYYVKSRRRVVVAIDTPLIDRTRAAAAAALHAASVATPPPPLVDSPKCPGCSLVNICLPDEVTYLSTAHSDAPGAIRRLVPAADDALPVYVQEHGARVGKSGETLEITPRDGKKTAVRLLDLSQLCLFGSVQISAQALHLLMDRGIPVCHFTSGGWFHGISHGLGNRNCELRRVQFRRAADDVFRLEVARGLVARKILNSRTLLRRNHTQVSETVLADLARLSEDALRVTTLESLLGVEGLGARHYFQSFSGMLRSGDAEGEMTFDFESRNRRPPRDPVNSLLSFAYSILSKDWMITLLAVGLDPFEGFYHRPRHGRAALALDLMEEFRPLIADSVVVQLINNGEVKPNDFVSRGGAVGLTPNGRKKFFLAYERRMNHIVTHPLFGYQISYRRLLEVQARLFGRYLVGEVASYDGFRTR